jgi:hypothetical protein
MTSYEKFYLNSNKNKTNKKEKFPKKGSRERKKGTRKN